MAANALNNSKHGGRGRSWLIAAVVLAVILLAAFMSLGRRDIAITAARARRGEIRSTITTNGKIEAINGFEAHAPGATTVQRILVTPGERVKAGQLLLQLDDAEARAQAAKAQAQLSAAQADISAVRNGGTRDEVLTTESQVAKAAAQVKVAERNLQALRRLQGQGAASMGEVQNAESRLQSAQTDLVLAQKRETSRYSAPEVQRAEALAGQAKAALDAAHVLLAHSEVRAPRAGTVYSLPLRRGQFVNAGDLLVQVAELVVFATVVVFGLTWPARWISRRLGANEEARFVVLLMVVCLAATLAEAINLEGIIGAFLAGLAVNRAVEGTDARHRLNFVGRAFFIPAFFVVTGYLVDLNVLAHT